MSHEPYRRLPFLTVATCLLILLRPVLADETTKRMVDRLDECAKVVLKADASRTVDEFVKTLLRTCEPIRAEFVDFVRDGLGVAMSREQSWVLWVARQEAAWAKAH